MGMGMPPDGNKLLNGGQYLLSGVGHSVQTLGRVSQIMQENFHHLHMSFSSAVTVLGNFAMLKQEMYGIGKAFTAARFLQLVYVRARRLLGRMLSFGRNNNSNSTPGAADLTEAWEDSEHSLAWIPMCLTVAVAWWLVRALYRKIYPPPPQPAPPALDPNNMAQQFQLQQQQQQQQMQLQQQQAINMGYPGMNMNMNMSSMQPAYMGMGNGMGMGMTNSMTNGMTTNSMPPQAQLQTGYDFQTNSNSATTINNMPMNAQPLSSRTGTSTNPPRALMPPSPTPTPTPQAPSGANIVRTPSPMSRPS
jgi:hypothetical protein